MVPEGCEAAATCWRDNVLALLAAPRRRSSPASAPFSPTFALLSSSRFTPSISLFFPRTTSRRGTGDAFFHASRGMDFNPPV